VEADLLRYYGVDLLDYHRGRLSRRRLRVLIQHLPKDAALVRAIHGEEAEWGLTEHLLAAAVDQLAAGNWMFAAVNTAEDADPPQRPDPIPRPGVDAPPEEAAATSDEIAAFFGQPLPGRTAERFASRGG
jgi:hypothetical protein